MQQSETTQVRSTHCAYCGYDVSATPVRRSPGRVYCSTRCAEVHDGGADPFVGRLEYKRFSTGVAALDFLLPRGVPTNSFILLAGEGGIRHRGIQTELLWRALGRGEPAIVVTFVDPPVAIVEHFLEFGWNVLPFLESGDLSIIDCYTNRLRQDHRTPSHRVRWNEFLEGFLEESVSVVRDASNFREVENDLHARLEDSDMAGTGLVVIDSLNEAEIQGREFKTKQFIKEIRGDVCSRKFVPIFASTTRTSEATVEAESTYLFDGIVDMRRNDSVIDGVELKQLSVRKMDGVIYRPDWVAYENAGPAGFQLFDPATDFASVYGAPPTRTPR